MTDAEPAKPRWNIASRLTRGGNGARNSDIDLVLYGELAERDIDRLWTLFDDSALSMLVDIVAYSSDSYPPLRRHIDAAAVPLFTRADLTTAGSADTARPPL